MVMLKTGKSDLNINENINSAACQRILKKNIRSSVRILKIIKPTFCNKNARNRIHAKMFIT